MKQEKLERLALIQIEEQLINAVQENSDNDYLDLEDTGLAWTWNVGDDKEYTDPIKALKLNECGLLYVVFGDNEMKYADLWSYDNECAEYIYDEVNSMY